jgi:hypothetical protein
MATRPTIASRERRVYTLIASLRFSGAQTAFFSFGMTVEAFPEVHVRAFEWLAGGRPTAVPAAPPAFVAEGDGRMLGITRSGSATVATGSPATGLADAHVGEDALIALGSCTRAS